MFKVRWDQGKVMVKGRNRCPTRTSKMYSTNEISYRTFNRSSEMTSSERLFRVFSRMASRIYMSLKILNPRERI